MKIYILTLTVSTLLAISCHRSKTEKIPAHAHYAKITPQKKITPVWGYRFVITGDFNGDGKQDTLTEHYYNVTTGKETNKYYDGISDYKEQVDSAYKRKTYCFLASSDKQIKPLLIDSAQAEFGVEFLKNEGDLDGDGADEVSFVVNLADWSSVNTCDIMTFKKGRWQRLYTFQTRDWEFPSLPEANFEYGVFGFYKLTLDDKNDSANIAAEKELKAFPGLIRKLAYNKVRIEHVDIDGKDTIYVDLRPHHHAKNDHSW